MAEITNANRHSASVSTQAKNTSTVKTYRRRGLPMPTFDEVGSLTFDDQLFSDGQTVGETTFDELQATVIINLPKH